MNVQLANPERAFDRQRAKDAAWNRYASIPHPDIDVGWKDYLAELDRIDPLSKESGCE